MDTCRMIFFVDHIVSVRLFVKKNNGNQHELFLFLNINQKVQKIYTNKKTMQFKGAKIMKKIEEKQFC